MKPEVAADEPPDGGAAALGKSLADVLGDLLAEGEPLCRVAPSSGWAEHPASRLPATSKVTQLPRIPWALSVTRSPQHRLHRPTHRT
ncbi:hypothetical protein GCM10010381_58340 [Streptomyces xantholiticus]|nr:hypothetical protein GCM10010381_58340 [Streptomyces xantholiticus]